MRFLSYSHCCTNVRQLSTISFEALNTGDLYFFTQLSTLLYFVALLFFIISALAYGIFFVDDVNYVEQGEIPLRFCESI